MRDAAKKAGFNQSAFTRWKGGAKADPEFVVKFARAFGLNVLEALVEAEFITEGEAGLKEVYIGGVRLEDATNQQILDEIMRRSDPEARELFTNDNHPNVIDIPDPDDLEERRKRALEKANRGEAAAQQRTPRFEEPELP